MKRIFFGMIVLLAGCGPATSTKTERPATDLVAPPLVAPPFKLPYDLTAPDENVVLPKELKEISGLTYYKDNKLLCVQDEEAVVYVYDIQKKQVVQDFGFGGYGDFEGIEYVDGAVYTLESNGDLSQFVLDADASRPVQIRRTKTDLPAKTEVEGLGYEPQTKRLLIAVKKGGGASSDKAVYSFDLRKRTVYKDMALTDEQLSGAGIDPKSYKPSGIAVHPITGEWYVLTSAGKRLLVTNRQASILHAEPLDPTLFRQPEGICFAPNGDLYVASEGNGKKGYIMAFKYKP